MSEPRRSSQPSNPDAEKAFKLAQEQALENAFPRPTDEERKRFPNLLWMVSPMLVPDPKFKGQGESPKVLREPLLMVSWDRTAGRWKWSLSDKTLNLSISGHLDSLDAIGEQIELSVASKRVGARMLDTTRHRG
jgi:hypothetical protein